MFSVRPDDSLTLQLDGFEYSVSRKGKLSYFTTVDSNWTHVHLQRIEGSDTSIVLLRKYKIPLLQMEFTFSLETAHDRWVVNDNLRITTTELGGEDDSTIVLIQYEETEESSIRNQDFSFFSPKYAEIIPFKGGFICRTGEKWGEFLDGDIYQLVIEREPKYLLLDTVGNNIAFMDIYDFDKVEDLGFGLAIQTYKGTLFATYDLKAVTTDDWSYFELKKGKIKAYNSKGKSKSFRLQ